MKGLYQISTNTGLTCSLGRSLSNADLEEGFFDTQETVWLGKHHTDAKVNRTN